MGTHKLYLKRSIAMVMIFLLSFGSVFAATPSQFSIGSGSTANTFFFANGNTITISERPDGEEGALITWGESGEVLVSPRTNIFGGAHDDDTPMSTHIIMEGGNVNAIFGGGLHKSYVTDALIEIKAGTINYQVCGGGASSFTKSCGCENAVWYNGNPVDSPCKVLKSTIIVEDDATFNGQTTFGYSLLFGGGEGISYTKEAEININGGNFVDTYVTAGGSNGCTAIGTLNIASGDFKNVVQGINRGNMDEIKMNISGGAFNNLYIGGETADSGVTGSYEKASVTISGDNIKITNLLPGSNGKSVEDDASKIEITLGNNVIPGNLTTKEMAESLFGISGEFSAFEVTSVKLDKDVAKMVVGNTLDLEAVIEAGSGVEDKNVIWESENPDIATVTDGMVNAVSTGETKIIAKSRADETKMATCNIRVISKSDASVKYRITVGYNEGGTISPETIKVEKGDDQEFIIKADEGYEIEDVFIDGESLGAVSKYKFENVEEVHSISVSFKKIGGDEKVNNPFKDVTSGSWYYESIEFVKENGLFKGMSKDVFGADVSMTRGMAIEVLYRLSGAKHTEKAEFEDVREDAYYSEAISWAHSNGIVEGIGDNKFAPDRKITREEFVTILYRYAEFKGEDVVVDFDLSVYDDSNAISESSVNAFKWAIKNEIVKGINKDKIAPQKIVSRAEVATMITRFCK